MRHSMTFAACSFYVFCCSALAAGLTNAELEQALRTISASCTQQHGYDPANPGQLGEHELGTGEKAWRECLYAGIRADLVPRSSLPDGYERIIAQDIAFTAAIEAGKMTRFERWQRNRTSKQVIIMNEALVQDEDLQRQQTLLDDFQQKQMELLLRTTPPRVNFR